MNFRKIGRHILHFFMGIAALLITIFLLLSLPPVQTIIAHRVVRSVNDQLGISLSVDRVKIVFVNKLLINGLKLQSQDGDPIVGISSLSVRISPMELLHRNLQVQYLRLEGADLHLVKQREDSLLNIAKAFSSLPDEDTTVREKAGQEFGLNVGQVILSDIDLTWSDEVRNVTMTADLGRLDMRIDILQPDTPRFVLSGIEVEELAIHTFGTAKEEPGEETREVQLSVEGFHSVMEDVSIEDGFYSATIASLHCMINNEMAIDHFSAEALVTGRNASLNEMRIESSTGTMEMLVNADYPSLEQFLSDPAVAVISLEFSGNTEAEAPAYLVGRSESLTSYPQVDLAGRITGTAEELIIDRFSMNAGEALVMRLQGTLRHILDPGKLSGELRIDSIAVNNDHLKTYLQDTLFPSGLAFPERLVVEGALAGSVSALESDLEFTTSYGDLSSVLYLELDSASQRQDFSLRLSTEGFDVGALLEKEDTLGMVAFTTMIEGHTCDFKQPAVDMELNVNRFQYLDVTCDSLSLTAEYSGDSGSAEALLADAYIRMQLAAKLSDFETIPRIQLNLDIDSTSLGDMHLTSQPAVLSADLTLDLRGKNWESLAGELSVTELGYASGESAYAVDSLHFQLENISGMAEYTVRILGAEIGDSVKFDLANTGQLVLTGDSIVNRGTFLLRPEQSTDSMEYDISFLMLTEEDGMQELDLHLEGASMLVSAEASLEDAGGESLVDGRVEIDSLDLNLIYPFLANQVNALTGYVTGDIHVNGRTNDPGLDGRIVFYETYLSPAALNTGFAIDNQEIRFDREMLHFDRFTLTDDIGNKATLEGSADLDPENASGLDLSFDADEFLLMDKSAATDDPFYGKVRVDLDASIRGSMSAPDVSIIVGFDSESEFTFVMPAGDPASGKGIVEFVDEKPEAEVGSPDRDLEKRDMEKIPSPQSGFEFTANLNVTDAFTLHLVTDPFTGEGLDISGSGDLAFSMIEGGQMVLTGRYEISEGSYELIVFDVIRRKFTIEPGSNLSWSGDILEASADLSAVYQLETSASNLLRSSRNTGEEAIGSYDRIPIEVVMHLSGNLLTPEVDFDIRTEARYQPTAIGSALSRLKQNESELNKQALSLLLLNRFTEDAGAGDPLTYSMKNAARKSLGNLLSQQINRFASRHLDDVDLSLQIQSHQRTGESGTPARTDVSLDVSRSMLNERLTVQVGGQMAVEESGEEGSQVEAGDLTGDFSLEYKLTPEGTWRLKAFNKTDYEDEIDGEVTKTGVSFIFMKEFDDFSNLFHSGKGEGEK